MPTRASLRSRRIIQDDSGDDYDSASTGGITLSERSGGAKAEETRKTAKKDAGTLHSFFNAVTQQKQQQQQPQQLQKGSGKEDQTIQEDFEEVVEEIEDDETYNAPSVTAKSDASIALPRGGSKRPLTTDDAIRRARGNHDNPRKLFKTTDGSRTTPNPQASSASSAVSADHRAWTERYMPSTRDELGVNKKKVVDVETWIQDAIHGARRCTTLVLRGPPGAGKTAVVKLLADQLGLELKAWSSPSSSEFGARDYVSLSSQFEDFIGAGSKFQVLDTSQHAVAEASPIDLSAQGQRKPALIVVEEFPSLASVTGMKAFRSTLLNYISSMSGERRNDPTRLPTPLILIISESVLSNSSSPSDKFTAHRILGPEILTHPCVGTIEFNEVAPTFLAKALKSIVHKRSHETRKPPFASQKVIAKLATLKDLRQAISTLEFLESQSRQPTVNIIKPAKEKKRAPTSAEAAKQSEKIMLDFIEERHGNLGLFHAVGKVVYNKRGETDPLRESLPPSEVEVDSLFSATGTDTSTFISALHENYILSCHGTSASDEENLDCVNNCLTSLCDADIFSSWAKKGGSPSSPTAGDGLKQEEVTFHMAVRGLLFGLPWPVKRQPPKFTGALVHQRYDHHRMFYPKDIKLWREKEDMSSTLDRIMSCALNGTLDIDLCKILPRASAQNSQISGSNSGRFIGNGSSARQELLLETLPYINKLLPKARYSISPLQTDIDRVTRFRDKGIFSMGDESDEELDADEKLRNNPFSRPSGRGTAGLKDDLGVESLILSDDDIEDDDLEF